jgi:coatomer protein complex subunit gamma
VDKGSVLQEKRIFNESPINPRKCVHLITKILYLLEQGQTFTKTEATDLFFATTMLFQSTDVRTSSLSSPS